MVKLDFRPIDVQGLDIIADFLKAVGEKHGWNRLFRGHANAEWTTIPSAFRPGSNGIVRIDQLRFWRSMAQRFVATPTTNEISYLVLAQHYGIPTGLLDWTLNPLIALFFASQSKEDDRDGQVVQIDMEHFHKIENIDLVAVFESDRSQPLLIDTSAMNVRSTAQDSFMTLHTANEPPLAVTPVFRISRDDKYKVRAALKMLGLSNERIYADLGVAAVSFRQHLADEDEMRELLGEQEEPR